MSSQPFSAPSPEGVPILRLKLEPASVVRAEETANAASAAIENVAAPTAPTPMPAASISFPQDLCAAFREPIPRQPASFAYQAAMFAVAVLMLLLPCIYVALAGAAGWWVWHYSTHILPGAFGSSRSLLMMAAVLSPSVVGAVIVFFMLKPLIVPAGRRMHPIKLLPQAEPRLHAFIEKLCGVVGAPIPSRIEVDCNVNAGASLRNGLRGFFTGEMTLTIGLPLVAGLSLRQFAGVLAHEFGHFAQGSAMRVTYLIRSVNAWFYRVVYERDQMDEWLAGTMFTGFAPLTFVAFVANIGVWFSRLILKTLMYLGYAASSVLLRQMEYDADRCEVLVVGSAAHESTTRRLGVMMRTAADLEFDVVSGWRGNMHLPDNFPALFAQRLAHLTAEQQARFEAEYFEEEPSWADSHPTPSQRVAAAQKLAQNGLFAADGAATALFENFGPLSQMVSHAHYEDDLDLIVHGEFMQPV